MIFCSSFFLDDRTSNLFLIQLKVNQVQNSPTLDSEATKEFYENIDKYIDQKQPAISKKEEDTRKTRRKNRFSSLSSILVCSILCNFGGKIHTI